MDHLRRLVDSSTRRLGDTETTCLRYFGAVARHTGPADILVDWTGPASVRTTDPPRIGAVALPARAVLATGVVVWHAPAGTPTVAAASGTVG